jgi:hypothetical protein
LIGLPGDGALEGELCLLGLANAVVSWGDALGVLGSLGVVEKDCMGESPPMEKDIVSECAVLDNSLKIRLKSCAEPLARMEEMRVCTTIDSRYSGGGTNASPTGMSHTSPKTLLSDSDAQRL